jgi:YfiH family protein
MKNKTEIITCPDFSKLAGVKHGFFTRKGGVSQGIYASLNIGYGSNDNPENVKQNRNIAMSAFGNNFAEVDILEGCNLNTLYQIHSDKVVTITDSFEGKVEADAFVTATPKVVLGILTADCTPVLFADEKAGVVGAAHAGWKGACGGILENTVAEMRRLGAKNIHAVIGPTISQSSYEVGAEFLERFLQFDKANDKFFAPSIKAGHFMFNLPAYVASRLANLELAAITDVARDTCSDETGFFSYRRSCLNAEKDYGRNLSVIALG